MTVYDCAKDGICAHGTAFCMDRKNFQNLQENVINGNAYTRQLETLLKSLTKEK